MKIVVCVKQVPDAEARLRVHRDGQWIDEEDLPFVINESDQCALEEALRIREAHGGEVVALSLGPERAQEALRKALAIGADRAVHLIDDAFAGGDAVSNGLAIAAAIRSLEGDLVLSGSQSDDLGYGATASVVAAQLGWAHGWLLMGIDLLGDDGSRRAKVVREMEGGRNEIVEMPLPAVLEVQAGINQPRYASLRGIMQAKKKPIDRLDLGALDLSSNEVGLEGARVELISVSFPSAGEGAEILEGEPEAAARTLVERLERQARVLS